MITNQRIHFIAIGGAVMHNLAICLKNLGNNVSGSDDAFFDPSKTNLKDHGLLPEEDGWHENRINSDLDLIILGMHAKADNPELLKAQGLGLKILSFPEFIFEASKDKKRVVVAGSHGKTTITSMIMHVLKSMDKEFDYLVGAQLEGFDQMVQLTDAPYIIIEGDEYTTSPLDLTPKFLHYKHDLALISGIAWDHFNVYPTIDNYIDQFRKFIDLTPANGKVFYAQSDKALCDLVKDMGSPSNLIPYGPHESVIKDQETFLLHENGETPVQVFGQHNMQNLQVAKYILNSLEVTDAEFYHHIQSFAGASKRMEKLGENEQSTVFKDFAHAPSKLKATSTAVKDQFANRSLVACIELHTFSSLNKAFINQYESTFDAPDEALVFINPKTVAAKGLEMISEDELKKAFNRTDIKLFTQAGVLEKHLLSQKWEAKNLLLMSSGNYGGLDLEMIKNSILN
ncbi:UDP-N-acetylmuramate--L-alanine ligase [Roseivirga misakiensis]|uniref:Peptidoglycan synthetase n=1 Tax=Roseivirga misakiensis TaxID=1563681 RepID=A0A1E5SYV1_9BACT|nr:Mur ligase family protein [Roseivirga misakiensis]OEK04282.1 peptidoglycan synthetase [Roseivirga misakiensis]